MVQAGLRSIIAECYVFELNLIIKDPHRSGIAGFGGVGWFVQQFPQRVEGQPNFLEYLESLKESLVPQPSLVQATSLAVLCDDVVGLAL